MEHRKLQAIREHRYQGVQRMPGDEYDAVSDRDAKVQVAIKNAVIAPPKPKKAKQDEPAAKKAGTYKRRDMTAED